MPLDATNKVPIDRSLVERFRQLHLSALGRIVSEVLVAALPLIDTGLYFAWDPLAAVAMLDPSILECRRARLDIVVDGENLGQTRIGKWDDSSELNVAVDADARRFASLYEKVFLKATSRAG